MTFVLTSTTEEQTSLNAGASDSWKTPPAQTEKPRDPGDVPAEIPQRIFNELREEQIAEKKKSGPLLFQGEDRSKKDVREPIRDYEAAKVRDRKAEDHKRELRTILERFSGERNEESQSQPESREQNGNGAAAPSGYDDRAAAAIPDFEATMDEADRAGVRISEKLQTKILAIKNPAEIAHIAYRLAKDKEFRAELEKDSSQLAKISPTFRHNQLFEDHSKRLSAHYAAHPEDQKAIAAAISSGLDISKPAYDAVLEQPNSDQVLRYLVVEKPEKLAELNRLYPTAAIAEVGKISDRIAAKAAAKEKARPPAPISPVTSSGTRTGTSLDQMSMRDYIKTRNKQEREYKSRWR